ncbi:MAG: hypothetical protein WAT09_12395 [Paracoccaceae bacterium]
MKAVGHALAIAALTALTALTGVGGVAWAVALAYRRGIMGFVSAFILAYGLLFGAVQVLAPQLGRVPLPCTGTVLRMQSPLYCLTLRNFVTTEMRDLARDTAATMARDYPGTVTLALDGGYPVGWVPMLPHLSHDDGEKLDLAFYYTDAQGLYQPGQTASPIGYFAFETLDVPDACPPAWPTLRWDMRWVRPALRDLTLDRDRTAALVRVLLADPRVAKVFVGPPLAARLGLSGDKLRFQGCRAARHDDHIHLQL